ncbi:MAG: DUF2795 domain-containing protein [Actinobacteria bacterium]|nr:DUF2795 domain-containing protein [Actinomycetota bacterium]
MSDVRIDAVTRIEIADAVNGAFAVRPAARAGIIAEAVENGARAEVVATLERLPDRPYSHLRQIWERLADVPVGE